MVNQDARRERHAKLKKQNSNKQNNRFESIQAQSKVVHSEDLIKKRFLRRVSALCASFMLVSPFVSNFQLTHGVEYYNEGFDLVEFTDQSADFTLADVMTEDGFLLKPAINSADGDRSGYSDIFMYTVEPGDTLSTIAESFNLKKETLMAENNIWNPNRLRVGAQIKVLPVDGLSHKVKKGETIDKIAKTYKVEPEKIISQNQIEEDAAIATNQVLIIPGAKRTAPSPKPTTAIASNSAPGSAAAYAGPKAEGRLIWPTVGKLTQGYHRYHTALDIANRAKGPIYAAASGKVIKVATGWNGGYGNHIIIDHGNGMHTLYAHNEKLYVTNGQYVEQGQTIAWMGRTGRVYGPTGIHLHFEVRINGVKYNPMNFF